MMRTHARPQADRELTLDTCQDRCWICGGPLWVAYHNHRTVQMLTGLVRLTLPVRRCQNPACPHYRQPYRPEEEGACALPHDEFGLDVIALVGALRYAEHRSVPEIHQDLVARGRRPSPSAPSPTCWTATTSCWPCAWPTSARLRGAARRRRAGDPGHRRAAAGRRPRGAVGHPRLPHRRGPAGPEPPVRDRGRPGARCSREVERGAAGADRRGGLRRPALDPQGGGARPCPACPTSSASSTTCARRPGRSTRPTGTPRRS